MTPAISPPLTFRRRFREAFEGDASRVSLYKDVSNGIAPAGIEAYVHLPNFLVVAAERG